MANLDGNGAKRPAVLIVAAAAIILGAASYIVVQYLQWSGTVILSQADKIARLEEREMNRAQYYADKFTDLRAQIVELKAAFDLRARMEALEDQMRRERARRWRQGGGDGQ